MFLYNKRELLRHGMRDGLPIGLGYFAVSFSLGITARNAGMTAFQGFLMSLLNNASAGEYAGIAAMIAKAGYLEMALIILVANARYLLMSCALSQKFSPKTPMIHRLLIGFDVTDELFGIAVARMGYLPPVYMYGAFITTIPFWATGTALGIVAGNLLPTLVVNALSVAIYGMFLAVIIPPCRGDRSLTGLVAISFALSWLAERFSTVLHLSSGVKIIVLTVVISAAAALLFPRDEGDTTPALEEEQHGA